MKKLILVTLAIAMFMVAGCTSLKVVPTDPGTGYFPATKKATIRKSVL